MIKYAFFCISIVSIFFIYHIGYATAPIYRPSLQEVENDAKPCLPGGSKQPLDDRYTCPVGDSSSDTSRELSKEIVECSIQMALSFDAIDKKGDLWIKQIQKSREKDVNQWIENIRAETVTGEESFQKQYEQVCSFTGWVQSPDGTTAGCAKTTEFFPEAACKDIVKKKVSALQNMGYILASKGIAKSFQNDKDTEIDKIKTAYDTLIDKWNVYKRRVGNAVSKFTAYIKKAVK